MKCKANCPAEPEGEDALKIAYTFLLQMCWPFLTSSEHAGKKKKKTQADSTLKPSRPTAHQQPDVQNWPLIALLLLFCLGFFVLLFKLPD